jgi:hypothetical protein
VLCIVRLVRGTPLLETAVKQVNFRANHHLLGGGLLKQLYTFLIYFLYIFWTDVDCCTKVASEHGTIPIKKCSGLVIDSDSL